MTAPGPTARIIAPSFDAARARTRARRPARALVQGVRRLAPQAAVVVLSLLAGVALLSVEAPVAAAAYGLAPAVAFGLALLHAGCVPVALVRPRIGGALSVAAILLLQAASTGDTRHAWPWWVVLIVTQAIVLLLVTLQSSWVTAMLVVVTPVAVSAAAAPPLGARAPDDSSLNVAIAAAVLASVFLLGTVLAQWRSIRRQLVRERRVSAEEHTARVLAEERAKVARELHDVIAHSMSLITVQATTARYRRPELGEAAFAEFDEIGASSRQALDEMRGLLGVLRNGDVPAERGPQPGLADVPELLRQAERAGMRATLVRDGDHEGVSELVGLAVYRIVQEALSNAIRHAPGAAVAVRLSIAAAGIDLRFNCPAAARFRTA